MGYPEDPGFKEEGSTSQEAAFRMAGKAGTLRREAYDLLIVHRDGLSSDQIADMLGETFFAIRPRVSELRAFGLVVSTGKRRLNDSGLPAQIWAAKLP